MLSLKLPLLILLLAACGGQSSNQQPIEFQSSDMSGSPTAFVEQPKRFQHQFYCPGSYTYNPDSLLCESNSHALGPFNETMKALCREEGGGDACDEKDRWEKSFARGMRGVNRCPTGTALNERHFCESDGYVYGPFINDQVDYCYRNKIKGCKKLKWSLDSFTGYRARQYDFDANSIFPLVIPALADYTRSGRQFGANRNGGRRKHAAADLIAIDGTQIRAVQDGTILDFYKFYKKSWALVVDHGNFIVRYGEVAPTLPEGIEVGQQVTKGMIIAEVGVISKPGTGNMLHFEMYQGTETGNLTNRSNPPYMRRADLMDPTDFLLDRLIQF
ncbi:MAG: M23 family metallopeptidase [Pseudobacteriovorax sp.]|nr:M23 family metallopeptidase [Pseudobacteriovorax sp.]